MNNQEDQGGSVIKYSDIVNDAAPCISLVVHFGCFIFQEVIRTKIFHARTYPQLLDIIFPICLVFSAIILVAITVQFLVLELSLKFDRGQVFRMAASLPILL